MNRTNKGSHQAATLRTMRISDIAWRRSELLAVVYGVSRVGLIENLIHEASLVLEKIKLQTSRPIARKNRSFMFQDHLWERSKAIAKSYGTKQSHIIESIIDNEFERCKRTICIDGTDYILLEPNQSEVGKS